MVGFDVGDNRITIITEMIDKTGKPIKRIVENIEELSHNVKKSTKNIYSLKNGQEKLTGTINKTTKGLKQFKMHLLSTMFFGQQLKRTFMDLLTPALETAGVFDVFSITLQSLFLPIALLILDALLPISDLLISLPEPIKYLIGGIALLAVAGGTFLSVFGQVSLFLTGLPATIATITSAFTPFLAGISAIAAPILAIIAVIAALWLAWKYNFGNIREHATEVVDGIKTVFSGLKQFFSGDIIGGLKTIIKGFYDIGAGIIGFIVDGITQAGHKIWDAITSIPIVGGIISKVGSTIKNIASSAYDFGKSVIGSFTGKTQQDFIQRPGMPATSFSPNDTIIGMKNPGSMGSNVTINSPITINATVSSGIDMNRLSQQIEGNIRQNLLKYSQVK